MGQRERYETKYFKDIVNGERPEYKDLSLEEKASICIKCGVIVDHEKPFDIGEDIICDVCEG